MISKEMNDTAQAASEGTLLGSSATEDVYGRVSFRGPERTGRTTQSIHDECSRGELARSSIAGMFYRAPDSTSQLAASQEQDMQVIPQRTTMRRLHVYVAGLRAWCGQQPAQFDHLPGEGAPVPPSLLGLLQQNPADDLRHRAEDLGYAIREAVITQNVPFRKAAHNRRAERIHHSADPGLADAVRAHRAWLDVAIKRVAAQPLPARCFLRTRQRDDFRVTRYVTVSDRAVDRLRDDLSVQSDDRAKGIFAFARREPRQLDATSHHRFVRCAA